MTIGGMTTREKPGSARRVSSSTVPWIGRINASIPALADQLNEIRANQDARRKDLKGSYDYIICGTGCAGSAVAGRLAAVKKSARILVLEAGGWDTAASVLDPNLWVQNIGNHLDWNVFSEPSPSMNGRIIRESMGRVVGGGSSTNALTWSRPFKANLNEWAEISGEPLWGYEHALEIFRNLEDWHGPADARYRGTGGPVWVQPAAGHSAVGTALLEAAKECGHPVLSDQNGAREEMDGGFAYMNHIVRDGLRHSMARAYLYNVLGQENITLLPNSHVHRVVLDGDRAVAVEVDLGDRIVAFCADREIVLCAGGMNSAKILMLSGIGNEKDLKPHGIKTLVNSPDVGANYHNHTLHAACLWESPQPIPLLNTGANVAGFWKSKASLSAPDFNFVQLEFPYATEEIIARYAPPTTAWALCAGLVAPKSRGFLKLRSANPADNPILDARLLTHPDDMAALAAAIEACRELGNSQAMRPFAIREVAPGKKLDKEEMADFIRDGASSFFHSVGTCRMGKDEDAVVDGQLRVKGVRGLRIADGSIMPHIVSSATMAACVLIGERMAEILHKES
ncbi:Glucose-methanol-choline oxidoreductase [Mesorhizobium sp. SOD10]|nr:Glucose-methanol-choline oxidoreductase [Mesorhizobium sp. SOD10]